MRSCEFKFAAELAELVDALDSDSSVCLKHSGSSPEFRIDKQPKYYFEPDCSSIVSGKYNFNQYQKSSNKAGS